MGTGASRNPSVGVPVNPRVSYADDRSKREDKGVLIDAPVLVKLQGGTVRYRFEEREGDPKSWSTDKKQRIERPHQGGQRLNKKHGYFFHSKLNDFGPDASYSREDSFKFCYVYKGAERAKQKHLYYVFGKGLHTNKDGFIEPNHRAESSSAPGQSWPVYKTHGHLYFDLIFLRQDHEAEASEDEDIDVVDDMAPEPEPVSTRLTLHENDRVEKIQQKLSRHTIKPVTHIHLYLNGNELQSQSVIGKLRPKEDRMWKRFRVFLKPK